MTQQLHFSFDEEHEEGGLLQVSNVDGTSDRLRKSQLQKLLIGWLMQCGSIILKIWFIGDLTQSRGIRNVYSLAMTGHLSLRS
jgi:hypothetical protein